MAERLTKHNETGWVLKLDNPQNDFEARQQLMSKFKLACKKLGQLEDIMERLGINFVEDLEDEIKSLRVDKYVYKKDRDTWKKTCEFLANEYAEEYFDGRDIEHCFNADKRDKFVKEKIEYFYQQAKKESESK